LLVLPTGRLTDSGLKLMLTKPPTMRIRSLQSTVLGLGLLAGAAVVTAAEAVVLENPLFRYTISADAKNVAFVDRTTGTDYLRAGAASSCAFVRVQGQNYAATEASLAEGRLQLGFGDVAMTVVLKTHVRPSCIVLSVESIRGGEAETLTFLNVPLALKGVPGESFGACVLALNLTTRVDALPALQSELRAACERKFGLATGKIALVGAPMGRMLSALQEALAETSELPVCRAAGPWARETRFNRGSYLFNFGSLTETNVDEWLEMTHNLGFTQIDNHGGGEFFRFGDMELNAQKWPEGWESWRRINARLHAAGVGSIFHTYAFFIDKRSKYVTPVPDGRLDAFRVFTLAEPLSAEATEMVVNESTAGLSTVTGFFEHNSVVLHLDDELVTFGAVSQEAPWRFTGLRRGAFGTRPAAHERTARARHLKECFGLFVPNPESSLFEEIAANHADIVNRCGFDGVYLDAIDGSSILRGGDECWYWANKFVVEIQKRLKSPVGMEMSAMWHHFWQYRTRWQAWDYPQRGHARFVDLHAESVNGGLLLPLHLGWWNFQAFNPPQIQPTYPEVMENLGARLIGWDAGISLTAGVNRQALRKTPLFQRAVDILRTCEELRHANVFDETAKAALRQPGREFALAHDAAGRLRFRPARSQAQLIALAEPWTLSWNITNAFPDQPLQFRLEALISSTPPTDTNSLLVADFASAQAAVWKPTSADGVTLALSPWSTQELPSGALLRGRNAGRVPRQAAWARLEQRFDSPKNFGQHQALAVDIDGDASGALLAIRMESPRHVAFGAVADRYVPLDFAGRRSLTLIETESARWSDYVWDDGKHLYHLYRETVHFDAVESISVWLQNLPPDRETKCSIGPIRALPLRAGKVRNPKLTLAGQSLEFPVELDSGSWIEARGPQDCRVYGSTGEPLGQVVPRGSWPILSRVAALQFSCDAGNGPSPRAQLTVFSYGDSF
jgi:hypothetical protein